MLNMKIKLQYLSHSTLCINIYCKRYYKYNPNLNMLYYYLYYLCNVYLYIILFPMGMNFCSHISVRDTINKD